MVHPKHTSVLLGFFCWGLAGRRACRRRRLGRFSMGHHEVTNPWPEGGFDFCPVFLSEKFYHFFNWPGRISPLLCLSLVFGVVRASKKPIAEILLFETKNVVFSLDARKETGKNIGTTGNDEIFSRYWCLVVCFGTGFFVDGGAGPPMSRPAHGCDGCDRKPLSHRPRRRRCYYCCSGKIQMEDS
jgi:hypothetical protein